MADYKHIKISRDLIERKLTELNIIASHLSMDMGHNDSFLSKCFSRGTMNKADYFLMCHLLNAEHDDFLLKEPEVVTDPVEEKSDNEIVELLKENNRLLRDIIEMWKVPEVDYE